MIHENKFNKFFKKSYQKEKHDKQTPDRVRFIKLTIKTTY